LRPKFSGTLIAAGGFTPSFVEQILAAGDADLAAFGRNLIAGLSDRLRLERDMGTCV
jgi:N-ethylmaleimide reductase